MASRIAWSSALRRPGLERVSRRTPSAGRSIETSPLMGPKSTVARRMRRARLPEHDERVALVDRVADLALDLPDRARDVGLDLRHAVLLRDIRPSRGRARTIPAAVDGDRCRV